MNWNQVQTIFWLRWRLICNQWRRGGGALGAIVTLLLGILALWLAALSFAGGVAGGMFGLARQSPLMIMVVYLVITLCFLFFWMIGLITELQRSEAIDLQKLMHLPVALGQMFAINYLASHFAFSLIVTVPLFTGLGLGLAVRRGPEMLLLVPLAWSMVLMVTAWTYCLRGWLATLMSNPRRRRTVIMCISLCFVLLAQGPNLYFNILQHHRLPAPPPPTTTTNPYPQSPNSGNLGNEKSLEQLLAVQGFIPPLWVPLGAQALATGNGLPAVLGTFGGLAIAGLGLLRAYRNTVRFYQGHSGRKASPQAARPTRSAAPRSNSAGASFLEYRLPLAPEPAASLALATFRSLLRAPEVKMAWASSFLVTLILGGMFIYRSTGEVPDLWRPVVATAAVVLPLFFLAQFFCNQFGFDRDGFRALMLCPAERRHLLLGKNLAALPVGAFLGIIVIALTGYRLHLTLLTLLATFCQLGSVLLIAAIIGNVLSILVPYRIQPGSIKPTKLPGLAMLVLMGCQMLFPTTMAPVFAGPLLAVLWQHLGWPGFVPVNLLVSAALLAGLVTLYWSTLTPLGRLLQRREPKILSVITVEVE